MARKEHRELDGRLTITEEGIPDPKSEVNTLDLAKAIITVAQRSVAMTKTEAEALIYTAEKLSAGTKG